MTKLLCRLLSVQATVGNAGAPREGKEIPCLPFNRKCFFFPLGILNLNNCLLKLYCTNDIILSFNIHLGVKE